MKKLNGLYSGTSIGFCFPHRTIHVDIIVPPVLRTRKKRVAAHRLTSAHEQSQVASKLRRLDDRIFAEDATAALDPAEARVLALLLVDGDTPSCKGKEPRTPTRGKLQSHQKKGGLGESEMSLLAGPRRRRGCCHCRQANCFCARKYVNGWRLLFSF